MDHAFMVTKNIQYGVYVASKMRIAFYGSSTILKASISHLNLSITHGILPEDLLIVQIASFLYCIFVSCSSCEH